MDRVERGLLFVEREELQEKRREKQRDLLLLQRALSEVARFISRGAEPGYEPKFIVEANLEEIESHLVSLSDLPAKWAELQKCTARLEEIEGLLHPRPDISVKATGNAVEMTQLAQEMVSDAFSGHGKVTTWFGFPMPITGETPKIPGEELYGVKHMKHIVAQAEIPAVPENGGRDVMCKLCGAHTIMPEDMKPVNCHKCGAELF